jgi:hypothetical protein
MGGMSVPLPRLRRRGGSDGPPASPARPAAPADSGAGEAEPPAPRSRGINTAWTLPVLLGLICLAALGWAFAHGTAATIWLLIVIGLAVAGLPVMLIALRITGYTDAD